MRESARNLLVGFFVLTSFVVLGVLMVWFGETPTWIRLGEWTLKIRGVEQLSGVGEGSPVELNGVEIGRVGALEFVDPTAPWKGVVIVCNVKEQYQVPRGAVARVYGATLGLGTGRIAITVKGDARPEMLPKEDAVIYGEMHSVIGELISKDMIQSLEDTVTHIGNLAAAAKPVADNLAELLEQRSISEVDRADGPMANVTTVIERIDNLTASINEVLGDEHVQEDVKVAVRDLRDATQSLKETVTLWNTESRRISENVNQGVDRTEENLEKAFEQLYAVLDQLDSTATSMARIAQRVESGEGTVGLLTNDERLYEAAVLTFERMAEAIGTIQRIAKRVEDQGYINVGTHTPVGPITKKMPVGGDGTGSRR